MKSWGDRAIKQSATDYGHLSLARERAGVVAVRDPADDLPSAG